MLTDEQKNAFRWPVSGEIVIPAPADRVWEVISTPGNLLACHPFCTANPVLEWPGTGARDEVHYLSGWTYERHFLNWIEGEGYDLEIGRPDGSKSYVSWRITPVDESHARLKITVYPGVLQESPVVLRWLAYTFRIRPLLGFYLDCVVKGFDWYLTRGEPVPRNQFGPHPWFSEKT